MNHDVARVQRDIPDFNDVVSAVAISECWTSLEQSIWHVERPLPLEVQLGQCAAVRTKIKSWLGEVGAA